MTHDLILKGGRVIDPSQDIDRVLDVAFADGKVAALGEDLAANHGTDVVDVSGKLVAATSKMPPSTMSHHM
jgi:dihydroorotase